MTISPSRALNVPSPKSPRSSSCPTVVSPVADARPPGLPSGSPGTRSDAPVGSSAADQGARSKATSSWRTEWVRKPAEMRSTPVSATALTVAGVVSRRTPRRGLDRRPSRRRYGVRRAACCRRARRPPPASSASASCSRLSTSTSIATRWPTVPCPADRFATEPAAAMWLSLISTASSSPKRWLAPPPHRTAYFSRRAGPGGLARVERCAPRGALDRLHQCRPSRWRSPLRRPSRLSPPRSRPSGAPAPGLHRARRRRPAASSCRRPRHGERDLRLDAAGRASAPAQPQPGDPARPAGHDRPGRGAAGAGTMASVVRSPATAEVLEPARARTRSFQHQPRQRRAVPRPGTVAERPVGRGPGRRGAAVRHARASSLTVCRAQAPEASCGSRAPSGRPGSPRRARAAVATSGPRRPIAPGRPAGCCRCGWSGSILSMASDAPGRGRAPRRRGPTSPGAAPRRGRHRRSPAAQPGHRSPDVAGRLGGVEADGVGHPHPEDQRLRAASCDASRLAPCSAGGGHLAARPTGPGDRAAARRVDRDAAHVVVRGRRHRDRLHGGSMPAGPQLA